jgi:hypothetical protein
MNVKRKNAQRTELFLVKPPIRSIRNEMEDSPVPATKKSQSEMTGFFVLTQCKALANKGILRENHLNFEFDVIFSFQFWEL